MTFNFQTQNIPVVTLGKRKYLVIFLHGYGSNGQDMSDFTTVFHHALADAVFICPNAPHPMMYGGHQWFPLSDLSKRELDNGAKMSAPWLNDFIDAAEKIETIYFLRINYATKPTTTTTQKDDI